MITQEVEAVCIEWCFDKNGMRLQEGYGCDISGV